jgi:hypothetical protein
MKKNVLMRLCRDMHNLNEQQVAKKLKLSLKKYRDLESGIDVMTDEQAQILGETYNIDASYFMEAAHQLELLVMKDAVILSLQQENKQLNEFMEKGYDFVHQCKSKAS